MTRYPQVGDVVRLKSFSSGKGYLMVECMEKHVGKEVLISEVHSRRHSTASFRMTTSKTDNIGVFLEKNEFNQPMVIAFSFMWPLDEGVELVEEYILEEDRFTLLLKDL